MDITDKDWLDLAWKHFQQHAQQRISYFNFFVIFSTILTSGIIATFQNGYTAPYLGIELGLLQAFLSFMFKKIDERNSFLTKHAENVIKKIEKAENSYQLFNEEEQLSVQLPIAKNPLNRQYSHGKSYKIIYNTFGMIGLMLAIGSSFAYRNSPQTDDKQIIIGGSAKLQLSPPLDEVSSRKDSLLKSIDLSLKEIKVDIINNFNRKKNEQKSNH